MICGDMSLVGPRPLVPHMLEPYPTIRRRRSRVRPGITGLWQVSARVDNTSVVPMAKYDEYYVKRYSLLLDLAILLRTPFVVLLARGAVTAACRKQSCRVGLASLGDSPAHQEPGLVGRARRPAPRVPGSLSHPTNLKPEEPQFLNDPAQAPFPAARSRHSRSRAAIKRTWGSCKIPS